MHKQRKDLVLKEVYTSIFVNFAFNLFLLSPLIILGINIFERHDVLVNSIGALPQEIGAFYKIQWFIGLGYSLLLVVTIVQLVTYYLYNGKYHPFAKIVMPDRKCKFTNLNTKLKYHLGTVFIISVKFYEAYELKLLPAPDMDVVNNDENQDDPDDPHVPFLP